MTPTVPLQNDACDCGVSICRYAYGLYRMRTSRVFGKDIESNEQNFVTNSEYFNFGADDIVRLRSQMKTLIEHLSSAYLKLKGARRAQEKQKEEEQNMDSKDCHVKSKRDIDLLM